MTRCHACLTQVCCSVAFRSVALTINVFWACCAVLPQCYSTAYWCWIATHLWRQLCFTKPVCASLIILPTPLMMLLLCRNLEGKRGLVSRGKRLLQRLCRRWASKKSIWSICCRHYGLQQVLSIEWRVEVYDRSLMRIHQLHFLHAQAGVALLGL